MDYPLGTLNGSNRVTYWLNRDPIGDKGSSVFALRKTQFRNDGVPTYRMVTDMSIDGVASLNANLYEYVANDPVINIDPLGLWQWGWPPWGNPKPKPTPPTPPTPPSSPACPTPPTPCGNWKSDGSGSQYKQVDCLNCCTQQFVSNEAKHPGQGQKNAMKYEACQAACEISDGDKGPQ